MRNSTRVSFGIPGWKKKEPSETPNSPPATEGHGDAEGSLAGDAQQDATRKAYRTINRKMDLALLPLLSILYLFNGLDRGNVGNAETQGFTSDIGAHPDDLNDAVSLFFVTFVTLQPISAALGRYLGAHCWIPVMMFAWGVITLIQAFIQGRAALISTRMLIGAFEAGFYPTAIAYLSFFYTKYDLCVRVALFYGQYAVAGAFSGSIAYGVFQWPRGPLKNWQYLFIIEGSLTCVMALVGWLLLPSGPGSAWFLSADERRLATRRIQLDSARYVTHTYDAKDGTEVERLTRRDVVETIKDWKLWYVLVFNICASVPSQAFSVFLPLVVKGLGYSSVEANLMSVPPYVCGAVGLYLFALSSDHRKERGYHIVGGILIALVGLVVTVTATSSGAKYAGLCILLSGSYVSAPLTVAWLSGNTPEPGQRALVLGVNGFGNLAGVIGAQLYRARYSPDYRLPFFVTLGFVATSLAGYLAYRLTLLSVNRTRERILHRSTDADVERERLDDTRYGDKKWTFIYGL